MTNRTLQSELKEATEKVVALESQLSTLTEEHSTIDGHRAALQARVDELDPQVATAAKEVDRLTSLLVSATDEINTLKTEKLDFDVAVTRKAGERLASIGVDPVAQDGSQARDKSRDEIFAEYREIGKTDPRAAGEFYSNHIRPLMFGK